MKTGNRQSAREKRILLFFKLTPDEWTKIELFQDGKCAFCSRPTLRGKHLNTDHCHKGVSNNVVGLKAGIIRGLLCNMCNRMLGRMERFWGAQVVTILSKVALYLKEPPAVKALGKEVFTFPGALGTKKHRKWLKKQS